MYLRNEDTPLVNVEALARPLTASQLVAKRLRRAADILRQGWCQHELGVDEEGRRLYMGDLPSPECVAVCARGALFKAHDRYDNYDADLVELRALTEQIKLDYPVFYNWRDIDSGGDPVGTVVSWNNAHDRTQEEVVALFERCATRLEAAA